MRPKWYLGSTFAIFISEQWQAFRKTKYQIRIISLVTSHVSSHVDYGVAHVPIRIEMIHLVSSTMWLHILQEYEHLCCGVRSGDASQTSKWSPHHTFQVTRVNEERDRVCIANICAERQLCRTYISNNCGVRGWLLIIIFMDAFWAERERVRTAGGNFSISRSRHLTEIGTKCRTLNSTLRVIIACKWGNDLFDPLNKNYGLS